MVPTAPEDTDYPDSVLARMIEGKSPLTAWRIYRGMTVSQFAQAYEGSEKHIRDLEALPYLKPKVIEKVRHIVHCSAAQLLRPDGMTNRDGNQCYPDVETTRTTAAA